VNETGLDKFEKERESMLSLPIKKKDLGNFVLDLLGQQQTIERVFEENFDFDFNWFVNLHELIDQRINQQTHSNLVSFTFIVYFSGGLKRTITSIEALKGYTETKKEIPFGVKIVWNYLVHFPGKDYPEKQVVSFSAFRQKNKKVEFSDLSINGMLLKRYSVKSERSTVRVQIDHTERTWGDDLEVIISNQVDEGLRKNGSGNLLYNLFRGTLALAFLLGGMIYGFISSMTSKMDQVKAAMANYTDLRKANDISQELISDKLDIIAQIAEINGTRDENIGLFFLYFLGAAVLSTVLLEITRRESHSFLVFSKSSEEYRMKKLKKEKKGFYILLGTFIFSVVASIVANFGYELIS
jgi:hypothetical protein